MARLERPRTDERTRLGVFADPHLSTRETGTSKLFEHTVDRVADTVADANTRELDAVVCVGDLTKDGEPWNYDRFDELIAELDVPFHAIPGNHDVPKDHDDHETMAVSAFADRYAPAEFPFHHTVGGVDLLGLNTAGSRTFLHDSHEGLVREETVAWLDETLPATDAPIVLAHHNFPSMFEQVRGFRDAAEPDMYVPPTMRKPDPYLETLAANDAPLVLTGHLHMPSTARERGVREVMVPTTCSFPQSYLLVEVGPGGTEVRLVPVADYDETVAGCRERATDSVTARGLTGMAATRLAQFPLVEE